MSLTTALPSYITNIILANWLQKVFLDSLRPKVMYRSQAEREQLQAHLGQTITETRDGLAYPDVAVTPPGNDPNLITYQIEQWTASPQRYTGRISTRLPNSAIAARNQFLKDAKKLAEHAGWKVDRLARNELWKRYLAGDTLATAATVATNTTIPVASLSGFRINPVNGIPTAVSGGNPLPCTFGTEAVNVVATTPTDPLFIDGPGTVTLAAGLAGAHPNRERLVSSVKTFISRPSGVTSVDSLTGTSFMSMAQLLNARRYLQDNNVEPFADGTFHMMWDPAHLEQSLNDAGIRQLFQGRNDTEEFKKGILIEQLGITFMLNNDNPRVGNVSGGTTNQGGSLAVQAKEVGGEITNQSGINVRRSILMGKGSLREFYIPEERFKEEAEGREGNFGYQGTFFDNTGGFEAMLEGIRLVIRPPIDYLMDVIDQSYSVSADWVAPTDSTATTSTALYKRSVVLETAG